MSFSWGWWRDGEIKSSVRVRIEPDKAIISYNHQKDDKNLKSVSEKIPLGWTRCNLGGLRPWFICPDPFCNRRVAILYHHRVFACRHCHRLAYYSQLENDEDRALRRAETIRCKLKWTPGILNLKGLKPKGMHWSTFKKLSAKHDAYANKSIQKLATKLNLIGETIEDWM